MRRRARDQINNRCPVLAFIDHKRIHPAIYIINTDIPDAHSSLLLRTVNIKSQIQTMISRHLVIITTCIQIHHFPGWFPPVIHLVLVGNSKRTSLLITLQRQGHAIAGSIRPSGCQFHLIRQFMRNHDIQLMPVIVTCRKASPVIDLIETPIRP